MRCGKLPCRFTVSLLTVWFLSCLALPSGLSAAGNDPAKPSESPANSEGAGEEVDPLVTALGAVVRVAVEVPANARTAARLGTERLGSGVVIDNAGLIVTIGYLVMEANRITITTSKNQTVEGEFVGYDHGSGLGLVRAKGLNTPVVALGSARDIKEGMVLAAASLVSDQVIRPTRVVSRRPFAGSWEYLLEDAIFTSPAIGEFGGAALIDEKGRLVGLGSLIVGDAGVNGQPLHGNMFVPVELLGPVMADLLAHGRPMSGTAPWLGMGTEEIQGHVLVTRVTENGPAAEAGVEKGDIVLGIAGQPVEGMIDYFRQIRALGAPGVEVTLNLVHKTTLRRVTVKSRDRHDWLRLDRGH